MEKVIFKINPLELSSVIDFIERNYLARVVDDVLCLQVGYQAQAKMHFETSQEEKEKTEILKGIIAKAIFARVIEEAQAQVIKQFIGMLESLKNDIDENLLVFEPNPNLCRFEYVRSDISAEKATVLVEKLKKLLEHCSFGLSG